MNFLGNIEGYFRESTLRIWSAIRVPPPPFGPNFRREKSCVFRGYPCPLLETKPSKYYLMGPFKFIVIITSWCRSLTLLVQLDWSLIERLNSACLNLQLIIVQNIRQSSKFFLNIVNAKYETKYEFFLIVNTKHPAKFKNFK